MRDPTVKNIKITIGDNYISVRNDGAGIAVVMHDDHKVYVPELIFGHLHSGENFDDDADTAVSMERAPISRIEQNARHQ